MGFEPMVRSRESLVFKTSSLNHSDTSPQWLPPECRYYYTKMWRGCQPLHANFLKIISRVNLTVDFLLRFVRVVFVLDKKRKKPPQCYTAAGKIFGGFILGNTA